MFSRFIHVVARVRISFLFQGEWYSILCIYNIWFIWLSEHGHLSCLHVLTVVNKAVVHTALQLSIQVLAFDFLAIYAKNGIPILYGNSGFNFLRHCYSVIHSGCTILHSQQQCTGFQFPHFLANTCCFLFLFCFYSNHNWVWNSISLWFWYTFPY